jgi:hypothetical protein
MMRSVFTGSPNKSRRNNWNNQFIVTSSDDEDEEEDSNSEELDDEEWEINGILDESESQYLIDWVGNYPPSWVRSTYHTKRGAFLKHCLNAVLY